MRMQRNSSFGRDDETEDRKEIYLSILFFSNFSPLVLEKLHHHAWPSQERALLWNASREGESTSKREDSGCLAAEGVLCSSSFVVKSYELKILFFCLRPDRWSLVWRRRGFQMAIREGSKEIFTFRVLSGRPFLEGRGCILFTSSFPSLWGGCSMCVCSLAYALIAYLQNRITIRIII